MIATKQIRRKKRIIKQAIYSNIMQYSPSYNNDYIVVRRVTN